jgi:hypothetical protein
MVEKHCNSQKPKKIFNTISSIVMWLTKKMVPQNNKGIELK